MKALAPPVAGRGPPGREGCVRAPSSEGGVGVVQPGVGAVEVALQHQ
jgi:hypothetical protein